MKTGSSTASISTVDKRDRLPGLDGIRAFAVVWVVLLHFVPSKSTDAGIFNKIVQTGGFGVEVFFVLSGFLITHLLLREEAQTGGISLRGFYVRRALRILPPLLFYLGFLAVMNAIGAATIPASDFLAALFFVRNQIGSSLLTAHLWTLSLEEQFYLVWPFMVVLLRNSRTRLIVCSGLFCIAPFWRYAMYYVAHGAQNVNSSRFDLRYSGMLCGALLALAANTDRGRKILNANWLSSSFFAILMILFMAIAIGTNVLDNRGIRAFKPEVCLILVALFINCALHGKSRLLSLILDNPVSVALGTISFSLYLWQQFFASSLMGQTSVEWYRQMPLNIILSVSCAVISYYAIELPVLGLRRRLMKQSLTHNGEPK